MKLSCCLLQVVSRSGSRQRELVSVRANVSIEIRNLSCSLQLFAITRTRRGFGRIAWPSLRERLSRPRHAPLGMTSVFFSSIASLFRLPWRGPATPSGLSFSSRPVFSLPCRSPLRSSAPQCYPLMLSRRLSCVSGQAGTMLPKCLSSEGRGTSHGQECRCKGTGGTYQRRWQARGRESLAWMGFLVGASKGGIGACAQFVGGGGCRRCSANASALGGIDSHDELVHDTAGRKTA